MGTRDPKPEVLRLEELALLVKAGEIKLPRFQRPFVWKKPDMLKLLDSIYKGYPIGSLLLWNSSQRLTSERSIAGLEVGDGRDVRFPTNYLLDGQQRLTTLCGALFWRGTAPNSIWDIHFDLDTETFVHPKDPHLVNLFPLNRLIETSDFIRQCMKFEHHEHRARYVARAERLLRAIKDYKVAVVKIGDMSLEEVAPIFERINSTGRKLTMVDLMMAATWSDEFDLSQEIEGIRAACAEAGFAGLTDQIILRSIAAAAGLGINKEDIQRLRGLKPEGLRAAARSCGAALLAAANFIRATTPIPDATYMPYGMQITHLAEYFRLSRSASIPRQHELVSWLWFTSASQYFGGASTGQNTKDLERVRAFAGGQRQSLYERSELDITPLLFGRFSLRTASSTTFALLLNVRKPARSIGNRPFEDTILSMKSSRLFGTYAPSELVDVNVSKILDPYQESENLHAIDNSIAEQHLLSAECVDSTIREDAAAYIRARAPIIAALVQELTGCQVIYKDLAEVDALGYRLTPANEESELDDDQ